jgi:hypothetical protein
VLTRLLTCIKPFGAGPLYRHHGLAKGIPMLDVILLALGLGFFAAAVAYTYACDRL